MTRMWIAMAVVATVALASAADAQVAVDPAGRFTFDVPAGLERVRPPDVDAVMAFTVPGKRAGVAEQVIVLQTRPPMPDGRPSPGHRWRGAAVDATEDRTVTNGVPVTTCVGRVPLAGGPLYVVVMTRVDRGPSAAAVLDFALGGLTAGAGPTPDPTAGTDASGHRGSTGPGFVGRFVMPPLACWMMFIKLRRMWRAIGD